MSTLLFPRNTGSLKTNNPLGPSFSEKLRAKYNSYMDKQQAQHIFWYMKVIIVIPCVYMVLSIMAMAQLTDNFEYYVGFTMLLFYANVCVHIVELKSRIFIPLYYFSLMLLIAIPLITYLLS